MITTHVASLSVLPVIFTLLGLALWLLPNESRAKLREFGRLLMLAGLIGIAGFRDPIIELIKKEPPHAEDHSPKDQPQDGRPAETAGG